MNDVQAIERHIVEAEGRIKQDDRIRKNIIQLEENINAFKKANGIPDLDCPLTHTFAPGSYARTIFVPKDTLVVTKIHKVAHLVFLMQGSVLVATEEGPVAFEAPCIMVTKSGTKRVVYCKTDVVWTTVHVTEKTDLDEIEDELIAKDFAELDAMHDPDVKQLIGEVTP